MSPKPRPTYPGIRDKMRLPSSPLGATAAHPRSAKPKPTGFVVSRQLAPEGRYRRNPGPANTIEMQGDSICITEFQFRWLYNMSECSGFNQQYLFSLRICSFNRTQQRAVSCTCHQLEQLKITLMSMPTVGPVEHLCRAPSCNLNFLSTRWLCSKHPERKWKHSAF